MIKLIATDMDGTFLNSDKKWDLEFIDIFFELMEKDIKFVIASGNQYYRLYQKFLPMSENMYFIGENGCFIAQGAKVLSTNIIERSKVDRAVEYIEKHEELRIVLAGVKNAYCLNRYKELEPVVKMYYCNYKFVDSYDDIDDDIMKIAIFDPTAQIIKYSQDVADHIDEGLRSVTSGNEWIDIMNDNIDKGVAIRFLQEYLGIKKEECMAFGDQMNDFQLLCNVRYSYAMANAVDTIKVISHDMTTSNDDQGVLKIIKEKVLTGKL